MATRHDTHSLKKSLGIITAMLNTILAAAEEFGVSDEELKKVLSVPNSPTIRGWIQTLAAKTTKQGLRVLIDYDKSLADMIAAGHYDWKNGDITAKNFKVEGAGEVETWVELIHFGRDMKSEAVEAELDKQGLRPAKIEELLALGAQHPDEQRKYPVPGLGSSCLLYDDRCVPYLSLIGRERNLRLDYFVNEWVDRCRFAAVRKS